MANSNFQKGDWSDLTSSYGHKLHCRRWIPKTKPRALVMVLHGFTEHLDYYEEIATHLIDKSFLIFGNDHYGHGRSEGERAQIYDFNIFIKDTLHHISVIKKDYPKLPVYLLGHSMGGAITLKSIVADPNAIQGAILISPLVIMHRILTAPSRRWIIWGLSKLFPSLPLGHIIYPMITRNNDMLEKIKADSLRWQRGLKTQMACSFLSATDELQQDTHKISCPFITFHGTLDKIVRLESSTFLYDNATSEDKSIKIYPLAHHSLLLELPEVKEEIFKEITEWLETRIPPNSKIADAHEQPAKL